MPLASAGGRNLLVKYISQNSFLFFFNLADLSIFFFLECMAFVCFKKNCHAKICASQGFSNFVWFSYEVQKNSVPSVKCRVHEKSNKNLEHLQNKNKIKIYMLTSMLKLLKTSP